MLVRISGLMLSSAQHTSSVFSLCRMRKEPSTQSFCVVNMRRVSVCLVALFVLACRTTTEPQFTRAPISLTIRVEGTVTAADDWSPVVGAVAEVFEIVSHQDDRSLAMDLTDTSGRYWLSFVWTHCPEISASRAVGTVFFITHPDFFSAIRGVLANPHITCTEELQTIDVRLARKPSTF